MNQPQWELVVEAVGELGGRASRKQVWEYLRKSHPEISFSSVTAELLSASVNAVARTSHHAGKNPRRTDSGNRYDRLFKEGRGPDACYVIYDPEKHGVWEIYSDPASTSSNKTSIRRVGGSGFSARAAMELLGNSFPGTYSGTSHIAAYRSSDGRQLAFDPGADPTKKDVIQVFVQAPPKGWPPETVTDYPPTRTRNHHLANHAPQLATGHQASSLRISSTAELARLCEDYAISSAGQVSQKNQVEIHMSNNPVNRILFGPPGTGKTYRTVDEALAILDPAFSAQNVGNRRALKARFDEFVDSGIIRFVTFHQSFSYEDFVEGIRASVDPDTRQLSYDIEDGVFKQMCEAARSRSISGVEAAIDITGRRIWKISLGDANTEGHVFEDSMAKGVALIGFGGDADLSGATSREEIHQRVVQAGVKVEIDDYSITVLDLFVRKVKTGDLLVVTQGNLKFRAIGEVTGGYVHVERDGADTYSQGRQVRWLRRYDPARPYTELMLNRFSQRTIYELRSGSINLQRLEALLAPQGQNQAAEAQPRVLIIDEINRGNVSRIFGELITLIEPSKREGMPEALEVMLPYSKERFSVPSNLHLIGTMNTADRSLAGLDIALRRRFDFVEMQPDVDALADVSVDGLPVDVLLSTINRRIELLLGRDYAIGHANFMLLADAPSVQALARIFRRQVLPLLQEYFYEDWQKIAWILNDHRKPTRLQFLRQLNPGLAELFGEGIEVPADNRIWSINADAFELVEAYAATIKAPEEAM